MLASSSIRRYVLVAAAFVTILSLGAAKATADLNPAAISYQRPDQLKSFARRPFEGRTLCNSREMDAASHEPPALSPARSVRHRS